MSGRRGVSGEGAVAGRGGRTRGRRRAMAVRPCCLFEPRPDCPVVARRRRRLPVGALAAVCRHYRQTFASGWTLQTCIARRSSAPPGPGGGSTDERQALRRQVGSGPRDRLATARAIRHPGLPAPSPAAARRLTPSRRPNRFLGERSIPPNGSRRRKRAAPRRPSPGVPPRRSCGRLRHAAESASPAHSPRRDDHALAVGPGFAAAGPCRRPSASSSARSPVTSPPTSSRGLLRCGSPTTRRCSHGPTSPC